MSGHVKESETAKILQLYATSILQVHFFVCQLDYKGPDNHRGEDAMFDVLPSQKLSAVEIESSKILLSVTAQVGDEGTPPLQLEALPNYHPPSEEKMANISHMATDHE